MTERFWQTERFDTPQMAAFMRRPDVYWGIADALAPQPEYLNYEAWLVDPQRWVTACMFEQHIVGFVNLHAKTTVAAELTVGFHPQARGKIAKTFVEQVLAKAWKERKFLTVWAFVAADNMVSRVGCRALGFQPEARLSMAIVRDEPPHVRDVLIYTLHRPGLGK